MALTDTKRDDIGWLKFLMAGWAFLECLFFGGLIYGWGSVVFVLKSEGIYAELCPESADNIVGMVYGADCCANGSEFSNTNASYGGQHGVEIQENGTTGTNDVVLRRQCDAQDSKLTLCFTIAYLVMGVGSCPLGHIIYKYGTRIARLIAFTFFVSGTLCMAFISKELPWLMFPGLALVGVGGLPLIMINIQVSNLFLVGSSTIVGSLAGAYDMSSAVMLILKIAYENGFSRRHMFLLIAVFHVMVLISTFLFFPKDFIPKRNALLKDRDIVIEADMVTPIVSSNEKVKPEGDQFITRHRKPSLRSCWTSPVFILYNVWLYFIVLRWCCFIGSLNTFLYRRLNGDEEKVSYFTNVCYYTMMGGLVSSFFTGIVYDFVTQRCKNGRTKEFRELLPAAAPLATTSLLACTLSVLAMIPTEAVLYLTFIVMTIMRSFLYAMATGFLIAIYPIDYVGLLYGINMMGAGTFGCLQYALYEWTESYPGAEMHVNIFHLVVALLSFVHPLYLCIISYRTEKKAKSFTGSLVESSEIPRPKYSSTHRDLA